MNSTWTTVALVCLAGALTAQGPANNKGEEAAASRERAWRYLQQDPRHHRGHGLLGHVPGALGSRAPVNKWQRVLGWWMRPYDAERLRYQVARLQEFARLRDLAADLVERARCSEGARRRAALEALRPVAARLGHQGLIRAARTGVLAINLQWVRITGWEEVSTSLGQGSPVRLRLPRTESISIGTTVVVPLGSGTSRLPPP